MTEQSPIVKKAVEELVEALQEQVDYAEELKAELEDGQKGLEKLAADLANNPAIQETLNWEEVPEDATPKQIAAALAYLQVNQMGVAHFKDSEIEDKIKEKHEEFNQDPAKVREHNIALERFLSPYMMAAQHLQMAAIQYQQVAIPEAIQIDTKVVPPSKKGGEWTVVTVPLLIENGEVSVPETLDEDFVIGGYISDPKLSLTEEFNIQSYAVPAGHKIEPFVLTTADDSSDAPKVFQRLGHWNHSTPIPHVHPITAEIPLLRPEEQQAMMQTMMGGGGQPGM